MNKPWLFLCVSAAIHIGALSVPGFAPLPEPAPSRNEIELVDVPLAASTSSPCIVPAASSQEAPESTKLNLQSPFEAEDLVTKPSQPNAFSLQQPAAPEPKITPSIQTTAPVTETAATPPEPADKEMSNDPQPPQPKITTGAAESAPQTGGSGSNTSPSEKHPHTAPPTGAAAPGSSAGGNTGTLAGQRQTAESGSRPQVTDGASTRAENSEASPLKPIPKPVYPPLARRKGIEGTVTLSVEILPDGRTGQVKIIKSSGRSDLDQAAVNAFKNFHHWQPKIEAGKKVTSWLTYEVQFKLTD